MFILFFCSTKRTDNKYSAPPIKWCRSRCHDTNIIANHTCTLAVKAHQQQDTQTTKTAYSNPRRQSHETHRVSTKDHTADIANLPKHTKITAAQHVRPAAPLQSYCRICSCIPSSQTNRTTRSNHQTDNCHRNPRAVCFCSTVRTNITYSAPPINCCRSRCHGTHNVANHTCTLAVKAHQQQDTQTESRLQQSTNTITRNTRSKYHRPHCPHCVCS